MLRCALVMHSYISEHFHFIFYCILTKHADSAVVTPVVYFSLC